MERMLDNGHKVIRNKESEERPNIAYYPPEFEGCNYIRADEGMCPEPDDFVIGYEGTNTVIKRYKDFNGKFRAVITWACRIIFERDHDGRHSYGKQRKG